MLKTRWECYDCLGKGTQRYLVEKQVEMQRTLLQRILLRRPRTVIERVLGPPEQCKRCKGSGVLILSFEEVQSLEDARGFSPQLLIKPLEKPIRPPRPVHDPNPISRCRNCGYQAGLLAFPERRNTLVGGDDQSYEKYCAKCGQSDPKQIEVPRPRRTTNWDLRHPEAFDRFKD